MCSCFAHYADPVAVAVHSGWLRSLLPWQGLLHA
ncbi:hypothetical protein SAMN05192555_10594 [Franzmannia pantelleriensis]|uniref:Uncharacterized protein n=1 Tax=Franzmannia pantelleriensis TaxID=48727 RepID=A0A1G9KYG9_9GAMM|nr:hypothetical protein SAMN05192555_10594 [Halomonas pantelleriensis]